MKASPTPQAGGGHPRRHSIAECRAEHVGSLLRPPRLLQAVRDLRAGRIDAGACRAIQDACIREAVRLQEDLGFAVVTDGEFRRRSWSAGFIDAVDGFALREGTLGFRDADGAKGVAASPYARECLRRRRGIATAEFGFLEEVVASGCPKITMPAPDVMHFFLGPRSFDARAYADVESYYTALIGIYHEEIEALLALGCRYLQLDDTALPCNCDPQARGDVRARGEDPDVLTSRYVALINEAFSPCPEGVYRAIHMCRGNLKGAWMAAGGYGPIAERVFPELEVDALLLEFDTERAGDFSPLRYVPPDKRVVLGLISTKTPRLESADAIKRRIDEAARYVPLERLALSPQCGFGSAGGGGQPISEDDQRRKLELVQAIARAVWD